ncbi:MAG TPA: site-2 protease family protein [Pyrinomonadaceae bacterium]|jgi:membrane-associated protease RseP (regulator of RpoE activity)|nr:site-2 protease family protein [Pyrinomonadaceae bacterium]
MIIAYILYFALAMWIHELGHLFAARLCGVPASELGLGWGPKVCGGRFGEVEYKLHALPVGAYVRLDMEELQRKPLSHQVFVLLAGILVNLIAAALASGTWFGTMNLLLAATNLLPLYQQDGWKCGMVLLRALLRRKSAFVEWTFTIVGAGASLSLLAAQALRYL